MTSVQSNDFTTLIYDIIIPEIDYSSESSIDCIFLVLQNVTTDLNSLIVDSEQLEIDQEHMIIVMYNILCCMNFIHTSNIIHRDIKPANILIQNDCGVKICDFGLARSLPKPQYGDMDEYVNRNMENDLNQENSINLGQSI